MTTISGYLGDAGLAPFEGRWPQLLWLLERPAAAGAHVLTRAPVEATITDATGAFVVDVTSTDDLLPAGLRYTVKAEWDTGRSLDVFTGLRVPPGDWTLADLLAVTSIPVFGSELAWIGPTAPEDTQRWMFWIDTSVSPPELKEWTD